MNTYGGIGTNRIDAVFENLKKDNRKALIAFIMSGDPDIGVSEQVAVELCRCGADIIELGIPFSDPVAEGPVIQASSSRALQKGVRMGDVIGLAGRLRQKTDTPIIFLTYFNPVMQYGVRRFCRDCASNGVDGLIIPDLPYEERHEIENPASDCGLYAITLVTPASGEERIRNTVTGAKGFIYCVSSLGVTGERKQFNTDFAGFAALIGRYADVPKAVGFGISDENQARILKKHFDGVIIGSAIVRIIGSEPDTAAIIKKSGQFISGIRKALDS